MASIIPLKDSTGAQFYPQTHEKAVVDSNGVNLQTKLQSISAPSYVVAWDGDSTPVVANIPAGVTFTYGGNTYTGTLAASSSTTNKTYLVGDNNGNFDEYVTQVNGSTYSWQYLGNTEIDLSDYATKDELNQLDQKVDDLGDTLQDEIDAITPIVIEGDVTNAPDEEDITTDSNNLLKFKNRVAGVGQMGYKILRKDASFASQVTDTNTIYEIRYDFDLNNATVTIPAGCVLKFAGGILENGTLVGQQTHIECVDNAPIFKDISLGNGAYQFTNDYVSVDWFDEADDADKVQAAISFSKPNRNAVKFNNRMYVFGHTVIVDVEGFQMYGNSNGGENGIQGLIITAGADFTSELPGNPLFFFCGGGSSSNPGMQSFKIEGLQFRDCPDNDVFQMKYSSGPARPFYITYCTFYNTKKAIHIVDNSASTNVGFMHIEKCTFQKVDWAIFAAGSHSIMGCTFTKNVAEQSDGCINLGYSDTHSGQNGQSPVPTYASYALSNNISITDNLLEGTTDCIYIAGGVILIDISRNYFERAVNTNKQFIVLTTSSANGSLSYQDNLDSNNVVNIYLPTLPLQKCLLNRIALNKVFPYIPHHYYQVGQEYNDRPTIGRAKRFDAFPLFGESTLLSPVIYRAIGKSSYNIYDGGRLWKAISLTADTNFITITGTFEAGQTLILITEYFFPTQNSLTFSARNKPTSGNWTAYQGIGESLSTRYGGLLVCKYDITQKTNSINIRQQATSATGFFRYPRVIICPGNLVSNLNFEFALPPFDSANDISTLPATAPDNSKIFVESLGRSLVRKSGVWLEEDGAAPGAKRSGTTTERPAQSDVYAGFQYYDTTLGKPIWSTGSAWVDATGASV